MGRTLITRFHAPIPGFCPTGEEKRMQDPESVPRDFWDGMVSIRDVLLDYGVGENAVEELLDEIERLIIEALRDIDGDTAESSQDEKDSP